MINILMIEDDSTIAFVIKFISSYILIKKINKENIRQESI